MEGNNLYISSDFSTQKFVTNSHLQKLSHTFTDISLPVHWQWWNRSRIFCRLYAVLLSTMKYLGKYKSLYIMPEIWMSVKNLFDDRINQSIFILNLHNTCHNSEDVNFRSELSIIAWETHWEKNERLSFLFAFNFRYTIFVVLQKKNLINKISLAKKVPK